MSECKGHVWDGITCKNCKKDIFDLYYDLRVKNKEFADITDEYVKNGYKLADAVEKVELENIELKMQLAHQRKALEWMKKTGEYFRYKAPKQIDGCNLVGAMYAMAENALSTTPNVWGELSKYAELGRLALKVVKESEDCSTSGQFLLINHWLY